MSLKTFLKSDLDVFFNIGEFAQEVDYYLGSISTTIAVQFFDEESDLGDSMMRKMVLRYDDLPNLSKSGYFVIDSEKYGVLDFVPDEERLVWNIILQKGMK